MADRDTTKRMFTHMIKMIEQHDTMTISCGDPMVELLKDVRELLKEQDAVKPVRDEKTGRLWLCGKCGSYVGFEDNDPHDPNEFDKYCRKCGRPVLWGKSVKYVKPVTESATDWDGVECE